MDDRLDQWMSVDETKVFLANSHSGADLLKYVRLNGDTFFFADASEGSAPDHKTAVVSGNAVSAAYVGVLDGRMSAKGSSLTLNLGPAKDDEELIAKKLELTVNDSPYV